MHAALKSDLDTVGGALVFADLPASPEPSTIGHGGGRSIYDAARRPNWVAITAIVALHAALLAALVELDVIPLAKPKPAPLVVELIAEPPPPPAEQPEPVPEVKVEPRVVVPTPIVQALAPPPPPVAVTTRPTPPKPAAAVAAPPPAGPVAIGDLGERLIEGRPPHYPMESRRRHEEGTVVLRLVIGTDGRVRQISVAQSSGFERLDRAALHAVRDWRWQPMMTDGRPVEVRGLYSMPFTLRG
jgi:protein TonB